MNELWNYYVMRSNIYYPQIFTLMAFTISYYASKRLGVATAKKWLVRPAEK